MGFRRRWPGVSYGRGEDWHYVGESGEPAFGTGWSNASSSYPAMAFRLREAGIVDLVGSITTDATGTTDLFTLPSGYRPASGRLAFMSCIRDRSFAISAQLLIIRDTGVVNVLETESSGDILHIAGSFFLTPPELA